MPNSKKALQVMRVFGLGFSSFLKHGNTAVGMEPRDDGSGCE
jgi:hypothetical protein